jgi:hypothetical protein
VGLALMADTAGRVAWRRWRGLLLWASVLLVLGAYLWMVDLPREREAHQHSELADKLLPFDAGGATALELRTADSTISLAKNQGRGWQILAPLKTAADQTAVRSLLMRLNDASRLRVIDEHPTALEQYGLAPPAVSLRITAKSIEHEVDFGTDSPVGASSYVRVLPAVGTASPAESPPAPVLLVPREVREAVDKKLFDLRNKELFDLSAADVTAVELQYPDQPTPRIRLVRQPTPSAGDTHQVGWQVVAPIHATADEGVVQTLVDQVSSLRATAILDTGKSNKLNELKRPKVEITLHVGERSDEVKFYFPLSEEAAYAVTTPDAPLYQVNRESVLQFEKNLFELRDKRIAEMDPEKLQRLQVDRQGVSYQLTRRGEDWLYQEEPLSKPATAKLRKFLDALWRARVEKVAGNSSSAWPKLGLGAGAITITLFSGDQTSPQSVVVRLGKQEGKILYIRRGDDIESYITATPLVNLLPSKQELLSNSKS